MSDSYWFRFFKSPCHKCPPKPRPQCFTSGSRNRDVRTVEMIQSAWLVLTRSLLGLTFRHKDCLFVHECSRASLGPVCCWQEETLKKERARQRAPDPISCLQKGGHYRYWQRGREEVEEEEEEELGSGPHLRLIVPEGPPGAEAGLCSLSSWSQISLSVSLLWRGGSRCLFWTKELQSLC